MPKARSRFAAPPSLHPKGRNLSNADIVITDNRIAAVGKGVKVPATAEGDRRARQVHRAGVRRHACALEFRTHDVLAEPQNWSLVANLAYGVTSRLDVQTSTNDYFAYQDLVETGQSLRTACVHDRPWRVFVNDFQSYKRQLAI